MEQTGSEGRHPQRRSLASGQRSIGEHHSVEKCPPSNLEQPMLGGSDAVNLYPREERKLTPFFRLLNSWRTCRFLERSSTPFSVGQFEKEKHSTVEHSLLLDDTYVELIRSTILRGNYSEFTIQKMKNRS